MRTMERNKRTVHVARRRIVGGIDTYGTPRAVKLSVRASRAGASLDTFGESQTGALVGYCNSYVARAFREFDRVYVYVEPPLTEDVSASRADYVVDGVLPALNGVEIRMKRVNT